MSNVFFAHLLPADPVTVTLGVRRSLTVQPKIEPGKIAAIYRKTVGWLPFDVILIGKDIEFTWNICLRQSRMACDHR